MLSGLVGLVCGVFEFVEFVVEVGEVEKCLVGFIELVFVVGVEGVCVGVVDVVLGVVKLIYEKFDLFVLWEDCGGVFEGVDGVGVLFYLLVGVGE